MLSGLVLHPLQAPLRIESLTDKSVDTGAPYDRTARTTWKHPMEYSLDVSYRGRAVFIRAMEESIKCNRNSG
jgi:hypothetical protein